MGGNIVIVLEKIDPGYHHRISKTPEMGVVLDFLSEDVTAIDNPGNVKNLSVSLVYNFTNHILVEIEMLDTLSSERGRPVDARLVVIIDWRRVFDLVPEIEIDSSKANGQEFFNALIRGNNFGLARAKGGSFLANRLPCNRPAASTDQESRQRAELEHFKWRTIRNRVPELTAPACVAEGRQLMTFGR